MCFVTILSVITVFNKRFSNSKYLVDFNWTSATDEVCKWLNK